MPEGGGEDGGRGRGECGALRIVDRTYGRFVRVHITGRKRGRYHIEEADEEDESTAETWSHSHRGRQAGRKISRRSSRGWVRTRTVQRDK